MYSMDQKRLEFPFISRKHMQNLYTINQALVEKLGSHTEQKKKFFIKDFFVKCDQIRRNWGFGHVYWKIIYEKLHFFFAQYFMEILLINRDLGRKSIHLIFYFKMSYNVFLNVASTPSHQIFPYSTESCLSCSR